MKNVVKQKFFAPAKFTLDHIITDNFFEPHNFLLDQQYFVICFFDRVDLKYQELLTVLFFLKETSLF